MRRGRRLTGRTAAVALAVCFAAPAAAHGLPLQDGLYRGTGHGGVEVAFSLVSTPKGQAVTRVGAVCTNVNSDGNGRMVFENADGDYAWLVGPDGRWGSTRVFPGPFNVAAGAIDGTGGTLVVPVGRSLFEDCDPALVAGGADSTTFAVSRVADPGTLQDGLYVASGAGYQGRDLSLQVWGGGTFVGGLVGDIGSAGPVCQHSLRRVVGGVIGAGGGFSLPWSLGDSNVSNPVTPVTGTVAQGSATASFVRDPPANAGCTVDRSTATFPLVRPKPSLEPLAAPPPLTTVPAAVPGAVPSTTCADPALPNRTAAGPFVLCSAANAVLDGRIATITGGATINGFLFADGGTLRVDTRAATVTSATPVSFGVIGGGTRITLGRTRLQLDARRLRGFTLPSALTRLRLGGLPLDLSRVGGRSPQLSLDLIGGTLTISAGLQYPLLGSTLAATGEVAFGRAGWSGKLSASGFSVPLTVRDRQLFELKEFDVAYAQAQDTWTVAGRGSVTLPNTAAFDAEAGGVFAGGKLRDVSLAGSASPSGGNRGLPGPYGTYLNAAGFALGNLDGGASKVTAGVLLGGGWPIRDVRVADIAFSGQGSLDLAERLLALDAQAAVKVAGLDIAKGDSKLAVDFDEPRVELETNVDLFDTISGRAHLRLGDDSFVSRDQLQLRFGPDSPPIRLIKRVTPDIIPTPDSIGPLASAEALISNLGVGARTTYGAWRLKIGISVIYRWGSAFPSIDANLGDAASIDALEPRALPRQAGRPGRTGAFRVPRGQQGLIVTASGSPDGRVVVRDPRGRVVIDTDGLTGPTQERAGGRVLVGRRGTNAGGVVLRPAAGRWTATTSGGSAPFTAVRRVLVPQPGTDLARVRPVGRTRGLRPGSRIRVRVTAPPGTRVVLRAARSGRAADIGEELARVRPGTRTVRVPRSWSARTLRLVAVTERGGVPVGSTRATRRITIVRPRTGRPGRLRVTRNRTSTSVRFARATGASRYVVRLTVAGRRYEKVVRAPRAVLRVPTRGRRVTVRVVAIGADGRPGRSRTRALR